MNIEYEKSLQKNRILAFQVIEEMKRSGSTQIEFNGFKYWAMENIDGSVAIRRNDYAGRGLWGVFYIYRKKK